MKKVTGQSMQYPILPPASDNTSEMTTTYSTQIPVFMDKEVEVKRKPSENSDNSHHVEDRPIRGRLCLDINDLDVSDKQLILKDIENIYTKTKDFLKIAKESDTPQYAPPCLPDFDDKNDTEKQIIEKKMLFISRMINYVICDHGSSLLRQKINELMHELLSFKDEIWKKLSSQKAAMKNFKKNINPSVSLMKQLKKFNFLKQLLSFVSVNIYADKNYCQLSPIKIKESQIEIKKAFEILKTINSSQYGIPELNEKYTAENMNADETSQQLLNIIIHAQQLIDQISSITGQDTDQENFRVAQKIGLIYQPIKQCIDNLFLEIIAIENSWGSTATL